MAEHIRRRLKRYFALLMRERSESKNKIGSLVGVSGNRITQWSTGERVMSPEKAFDLGDALRTELEWQTSGIEFLWACGYWAEILSVFKHLSADLEDGGPGLAIKLYSWLPSRMFDFERDEITDRLAEKFHFDPGVLGTLNDIWAMGIPDIGEPDIILAHNQLRAIAEEDHGASELQRYFLDRSMSRQSWAGMEVQVELESLCETSVFQDHVTRAWHSFNNGDLADNRAFAARVGTAHKIATMEMHVIDAITAAARNLSEVLFPSFAVPRIWRMAAGWVYEIDRSGDAAHWASALPDNFVNVPDVNRRNDEEARSES
jgi:hypothetical protein